MGDKKVCKCKCKYLRHDPLKKKKKKNVAMDQIWSIFKLAYTEHDVLSFGKNTMNNRLSSIGKR